MRSVFYWGKAGLGFEKNNPYGPLLARAMAGVGVELEAGYDEDLSESWLMENRGPGGHFAPELALLYV